MANSWGAPGKQPALPPKSPGSTLPPSYVDFSSNLSLGTIGPPKSKQGCRHQRTSSESNLTLIEEQPSWLDDLLNEPDIPIGKGSHRRSSSDSFTHSHIPSSSSALENVAFHSFNYTNIGCQAAWKQEQPLYADANSSKRPFGRKQEMDLNTQNNPGSSNSLVKSKSVPQLSSVSASKEAETSSSSAGHNQQESAQSVEGSSEKTGDFHAKKTQSEMEVKRIKQQHAQRSRVRKLQYIVELERTVQALQAEGMEVAGEIEFLSQQNLILSLENKALKQRLDSLSQEHLIKCFEHDMLEREMSRMQAFIQYQQLQQQLPRQHSQHQRQQQQNPNSSHSRGSSRDLDQQFSNLSLKQKDGVHGDGHLHIQN